MKTIKYEVYYKEMNGFEFVEFMKNAFNWVKKESNHKPGKFIKCEKYDDIEKRCLKPAQSHINRYRFENYEYWFEKTTPEYYMNDIIEIRYRRVNRHHEYGLLIDQFFEYFGFQKRIEKNVV